MALTGSTIASTYLKLLRINTDTMGADATASYIQDSADTDSALSISTTRVGIGTATPREKLDVNGDIANWRLYSRTGIVNGALAFNSYYNGSAWVHDDDSKVSSNIYMSDSRDSLEFAVRAGGEGAGFGTTHLVIGGDGNVGINESSPAHKLDVDGGIVEQGGVLKENLITNSGFDVWSNSTLENVGSDLVLNGAFESDTTGWGGGGCSLSISGDGGGQSGENLILTRSSGSSQYAQDGLTVEVGKLYKLTAYVKEGSGGAEAFQISFVDSATNEVGSISGTSSGSWVAYSVVVEATTTTSYLRLYKLTATAGTMFFDTVSCYEVTPGCVAADALACDGWLKNSGLDVYREHNGSNTKDGSFYALQSSPTAQNDYFMSHSGIGTSASHYMKFRGRKVTLGAWIKSSTANDIQMTIEDGVGATTSTQHTGGGTYEWLEVTHTVDSSNTQFDVYFQHKNASPGDAYISQPMLVFGSSIGEGNYTRPVNEVVTCEKAIYPLLNETISSDADYNLESLTSGKIPKGTKALFMRGHQTPAAQGDYFGITCEGDWQFLTYHPTANTTDWHARVNVEQSGDAPQIRIQRSATKTISSVYMNVTAVELF